MKAHKVVLVFVDHDGIGAKEAKLVLENTRYPNRCMYPDVLEVQTVDVGEWNDDHPLNRTDPEMKEWKKLFADASPSVIPNNPDAMWCEICGPQGDSVKEFDGSSPSGEVFQIMAHPECVGKNPPGELGASTTEGARTLAENLLRTAIEIAEETNPAWYKDSDAKITAIKKLKSQWEAIPRDPSPAQPDTMTVRDIEGIACLAALKLEMAARLIFLQEYNRMKADPEVLKWLRIQSSANAQAAATEIQKEKI